MIDEAINVRGSVLRAPQNNSRVVTFRASTPTLDRHGTRVIPSGIDTSRFDRNPIFLWGHDGYGAFGNPPEIDAVIGRVVAHRTSDSAFDIDVEFAPADVNERAEQAFRLVKSGYLNAVSIGFYPRVWHQEQAESGEQITVYDKVELLEVSLVPVPSNPDAIALTRHLFGGSPDIDQMIAVDTILRVGKVLSSANKAKLKQAAQLINDVLASAESEEDQSTHAANRTPPDRSAEDGARSAATSAVRTWLARRATERAMQAFRTIRR